MKKVIGLAVLTIGIINVTHAQAHEGVYKTRKIEQPAIVATYNYSQDIVKNALVAKMTDKRIKGEDKKGVLKYTNAVLKDISRTPLDYSFIIEDNGGRKEPKSTIYLIMEGANVAAADAASCAANGKSFLNDLLPDVQRSNVIFQIKKQEQLLLKEEENLLTLKKEHSKIESKLKENKQSQEKQQRIIDSQKSVLDDLKVKL